MSEERYDLIVIGAGPGGYVAAIRAAQLGMRVACVEKDAALGGTCLNVGCIPSKALLDSSERYHQAKNGQLAAHGVRLDNVELDLEAMMARKEKVVATLTRGVAGLFKKNQIAWLKGSARLRSPDSVEIRGKETHVVNARRILIATGSAPVELPGLQLDGERIICSTEALSLRSVPPRMLVIGGGAIGLEMGSVWSRLGSEVVIVEMMSQIVPGMDTEMARALQKILSGQGMRFRLNTTFKRVDKKTKEIRALLEGNAEPSEEVADVLLVAVGRRPYTDDLGLEELGIATDERGRIKVDDSFATNVPGVYAIGDVIPGPMLAHKAEEEGIAAVERMAGLAGHVNYDAVPNVVYTWPELASVGMSEEAARERGGPVRTGSFPFLANGRARCMNETEGSIKVVADEKTDRVLGIHILGPHASDLIAEAALAMEFSSSAEDIARSVHAHPTLAEVLKEAALGVAGRSLHR
jgi:dihydrolipoamide dehydrogenase